jgi:hypothetical protein
MMRAFTAYQTRYSPEVRVQEHGIDSIVGLRSSPSIVWICAHFEARNYDEAVSEARRLRADGAGEITHAGLQLNVLLGGKL